MRNQNTASSITESRIRRILELQPELRRRTKKDAKRFLDIPHLPDIGRVETIIDVVTPQMSKYFADLNEDPLQFFKDRSRMLMIFHAPGDVRPLTIPLDGKKWAILLAAVKIDPIKAIQEA